MGGWGVYVEMRSDLILDYPAILVYGGHHGRQWFAAKWAITDGRIAFILTGYCRLLQQENEEARPMKAGFSNTVFWGRGDTPTSVTCCPCFITS